MTTVKRAWLKSPGLNPAIRTPPGFPGSSDSTSRTDPYLYLTCPASVLGIRELRIQKLPRNYRGCRALLYTFLLHWFRHSIFKLTHRLIKQEAVWIRSIRRTQDCIRPHHPHQLQPFWETIKTIKPYIHFIRSKHAGCGAGGYGDTRNRRIPIYVLVVGKEWKSNWKSRWNTKWNLACMYT